MLVIGLMSGTSVDGIDAVLVDIVGRELDLKIKLIAGKTYPYSVELREKILNVCGGGVLSMAEFAALDDAIAKEFAAAAIALQKNQPKAELIGSHGQTVYHRPLIKKQIGQENPAATFDLGYSLQLGRGALIAYLTGIPTVSNFRSADIADRGQGAPLVPRVDAYLLGDSKYHRCVQNLGGIGNVTYIPAQSQENWLSSVLGWDTGPGNTLLDLAVEYLSKGEKTYDKDGEWAATGNICQPLAQKWLKHDFFQQPPPKSTGRELFGLAYLQQCLADAQEYNLSAADLLATLTELTAISIKHSYDNFLPQMPQEVFLCGGGSRNLYLKARLIVNLGQVRVLTTDEVGLNADLKESIAFAVLAYWHQLGIPGNLPEVTGARSALVLGDFHSVNCHVIT